MLKKIKARTEYFYDIPEQVSATGRLPERDIYTKLELEDNTVVWLDYKGKVISNETWILKLSANSSESSNNTNTLLGAVREFEIWMEGYAATGEHGTAHMIGKGFGSTFDEAVKDYMSKNPKHGIEENGRSRYISEDAYKNRRSNWNIWACSLFDNETDARKLFG